MRHPNCKALSRFLDQPLPIAKKEALASHTEGCEKCQALLRVFEQIDQALLPQHKLPENFAAGIVEKLGPINKINQSAVATVQAISGSMKVQRSQDDPGEEAFPGMALHPGDNLILPKNSRALMELNDGSQLWLNQETEIKFTLGQSQLSLVTGELFAMMKSQKNPFKIKTPSALLSVIGTDFDAQVNEKKETLLQVLKGKVDFKNDSGSALVKRNKQVKAGRFSKPKPTEITNAENITKWTGSVKSYKNNGGGIMKKTTVTLLSLIIVAGVIWIGANQNEAKKNSEWRASKKSEYRVSRKPSKEELSNVINTHFTKDVLVKFMEMCEDVVLNDEDMYNAHLYTIDNNLVSTCINHNIHV